MPDTGPELPPGVRIVDTPLAFPDDPGREENSYEVMIGDGAVTVAYATTPEFARRIAEVLGCPCGAEVPEDEAEEHIATCDGKPFRMPEKVRVFWDGDCGLVIGDALVGYSTEGQIYAGDEYVDVEIDDNDFRLLSDEELNDTELYDLANWENVPKLLPVLLRKRSEERS